MNALNRLVMLVIVLLLVAVPVLLLLVAFGIISTGVADQYTGYQSGLQALGSLSVSDLGSAGTIAGIVGVVVALMALILLLQELKFWQGSIRNVVIDGSAGKEIRLEAGAARELIEGAAREAGAASPKAALSSRKRSYRVSCSIEAPASSDLSEFASRARKNIRQTLESQNVAVKDAQVTLRATDSKS